MNPEITGREVFITGGAGFIGSTLIGRLIETNRITVYDDFRRDALSGRPYANHPNLRIVRGNVLDFPALREAMQGAQIVVHCAAIAGILTAMQRPAETLRVNVIGTANALEAAKDIAGLERFVDFSTSEVFGASAFRADEDDIKHIGAIGETRWNYAVSKLAGEHLTKAYYDQYRMPVVTIRPFNIYGPGQVGEAALPAFVLRALRNEEIEIHGDGNQIRAWCFIDDFIDGLLLAMVHPNAVGEAFNIGNARAVITIYGLVQTVLRVLESRSTVSFTRKDYADVELRVPSVRKAREMIGYEAKVDLEEGIRRTAEYFRAAMP